MMNNDTFIILNYYVITPASIPIFIGPTFCCQYSPENTSQHSPSLRVRNTFPWHNGRRKLGIRKVLPACREFRSIYYYTTSNSGGPFQFELLLNIIFVHLSNFAESFRCVRYFFVFWTCSWTGSSPNRCFPIHVRDTSYMYWMATMMPLLPTAGNRRQSRRSRVHAHRYAECDEWHF